MELFILLFLKLMPLYMNMAMGYVAGKFLNTPRDAIARIMFYMINPIIIFNGVLNTRIDRSVLSLPFLVFVLSVFLCWIFYKLAGKAKLDSSQNMIAYMAGSGNTGYFGLPLALLLFNDQGEGVYIMAMLGMTLYENSIGFYVCAKGTHSAAECIAKIFKLPTIYAFAAALTLNLMHVHVPDVFIDFMGYIKGTYTVLGMMIIGLGLAGLQNYQLDFKFIGLTFLAKFLAWPLLILTITSLDSLIFGIYTQSAHDALILLSIVPLPVSSVILALVLQSQPEKTATTVLLSTFFAMIYVPFMAIYFLSGN